MSLSVLNNIAAIQADTLLGETQAGLQTVLRQLSSGSRINSGADDAAGLSVVAGLAANRAALTQSAANAQAGAGLLQVADGALAQVTRLLDRAVTLSTETASGTLNAAQSSSADTEYQGILQEIGSIGAATSLNGQAVFSNALNSIFVGDGTLLGGSAQSFKLGTLTISSIGQTPQGPSTPSSISPLLGAPAAAISSSAGVYSLRLTAANDTISGGLSVQVGSGGAVTTLTVATGTTQAQLAAQVNADVSLSALGATATLDGGGNLQITGPTSGDALSFAGTSLVDAQTSTAFVPTDTTASVEGQYAISILYERDASSPSDPIVAGGTLTVTYNGATFNYTAPSGTTVGDLATDLAPVFAGSDISVDDNYFPVGPGQDVNVLAFTANFGETGTIGVVSNLTDAVGSLLAPELPNQVGIAPVVPYETYAFSSNTSVFSGDLAITSDTNPPETVPTTGLTGAQAADAINNDVVLQSYPDFVSATYDSTSHELVVYGNPYGGVPISATGANGTIYEDPVVTSLASASAPVTAVPAHGGSAAIKLGEYNDTVSGQLKFTEGSSGLPQDALSLDVAPGTTGQRLADLINGDAAFQAAGVTANYDATNYTVTATAPAGLANTLTNTGTTLTDTGGYSPGPGTSLAGTSLGGGAAGAVLVAVTAAIQNVAYQRGVLGESVNRLTAEANVASAEDVNLTAASNAIEATNYGAATSSLAKYEVLSQVGIAALAQANSVAKEVLRLLG